MTDGGAADPPVADPVRATLDRRAYWDEQANAFDEEPDHGLRDPSVRAAWRALLLRHLPPAPADLLDLGSGTGSLSVLLAEAGYTLHGVDLSPQMVLAARSKAAAAGVTATFEEGDAGDPPGQPKAYDVVLTRHVLWALPQPGDAVRRWVDLLRPGGRLLLVEGRWWTGGGLTANQVTALVAPHTASRDVVPLPDPDLWGGPVDDERYLVVATRT